MDAKTVKREIKRHGNGAMVSVHKQDLEDLGVEVGATVEVTITPIGGAYEATRESARRMRGRWARTLDLLGK